MHKTAVVHYSSCVYKLFAAAEGCLGDCHLMLVDVTYYIIGLTGFGN